MRSCLTPVPRLRRSGFAFIIIPASRPGLRTAGPSGLFQWFRISHACEFKAFDAARADRKIGPAVRDCFETCQYMCGRAIKPVRLPRGTTESLKVKAYRLR